MKVECCAPGCVRGKLVDDGSWHSCEGPEEGGVPCFRCEREKERSGWPCPVCAGTGELEVRNFWATF